MLPVCRFFYDKSSNVLWCLVPKAGSTTYTAAFARLADSQRAKLDQSAGKRAKLKRYFHFDSHNMARVLARRPFLFAVSRHPYERLVSAFIDHSDEKTKGGTPVRGSFEDFLTKVVLKQAESCSRKSGNCSVNRHWDSLDNLCSFCALNYTVVSSMDTFAEDFTHITARLGLEPQAK